MTPLAVQYLASALEDVKFSVDACNSTDRGEMARVVPGEHTGRISLSFVGVYKLLITLV